MKETIDLSEESYKRKIVEGGRAVGNTTRSIDLAIQLLFQGYKLEVRDPCWEGTHSEANRNIFDRLLRRLFREHPAQMKDHVKYDKGKLTIEFI